MDSGEEEAHLELLNQKQLLDDNNIESQILTQEERESLNNFQHKVAREMKNKNKKFDEILELEEEQFQTEKKI